ncbi:MAG: tRNA (adenosine(37)-N6)-dimethylallyltransferase, partial [Flavitalea sp.]
QNPQRLMRALEVFIATGKSISYFRKGNKAVRDFQIIKIALNLPKEELQRNINTRVDQMVAAGLEAEAKSLIEFQHLNALQTVGYREWFDHFNGLMSKEAAIERIKINTRQYAKRQITWFKKDEKFEWMKPDEAAVIDFVDEKIKSKK